ncbi:MAG: CBS domain-containing protein [Trebonia sp.]
MRVEYLYVPDVLSCRSTDRLADAARRLTEAGVGALAVLDDRAELTAIISERDLARALAEQIDPTAVDVAAYASRNVCVATVGEDSSAVGRRMLDAGIRHLPVMDRGQLAGMVSMRDLLAVQTWA